MPRVLTPATRLLARVGLIGLGGSSSGCTPAECPCEVESPDPTHTPAVAPGDAEPSGLREVAKPALATSTTGEPRFDAVPAEFCTATLQRRDQSLVRTASFLEAWNELAPPIRNNAAINIPVTEIDARLSLCASLECTIAEDRVVEVTADYMVGVGALLPTTGQLLVIPEIAPAHSNTPCSSKTTLEVERAGAFIHVRATNEERRYTYSHGHYNYGHYGPSSCESYGFTRRDLIIDASSFELELLVEQPGPAPEQAWVELAIEPPGVVLRGCDAALELRWTP